MKNPMDGGPRDAVSPGDLAETLPAPAFSKDGITIESKRWTSDMLAIEPGAPHAGAHPLDDQAAFKFRDRTDDHDDGAAQRPAGVDLFAEADELDVQSVEFVEHFQEVPSRASDAITGPDQNNIEAAAAGVGHQLIESWPAGFRTGDPVRVLLHDLEATLGSQLAKVEELGFRVLVDGRDSHIQGGALHGRL